MMELDILFGLGLFGSGQYDGIYLDILLVKKVVL